MHESSDIVKAHIQEWKEELDRERDQLKVIPEPVTQPWDFQHEIDVLIANGFAIRNEASTAHWKALAWRDAKPSYHISYQWTQEGQKACFRWVYSTPMSWAAEIHDGHTRHCVVCMRDCFRRKVWASNGRFRCVCMECGAKGHDLQDLAKTT